MAPGRSETEIGAHFEGYNRGAIGICLLGGHLGANKARDGIKSHSAKLETPARRSDGRPQSPILGEVVNWPEPERSSKHVQSFAISWNSAR
jgi:hypothetical protein